MFLTGCSVLESWFGRELSALGQVGTTRHERSERWQWSGGGQMAQVSNRTNSGCRLSEASNRFVTCPCCSLAPASARQERGAHSVEYRPSLGRQRRAATSQLPSQSASHTEQTQPSTSLSPQERELAVSLSLSLSLSASASLRTCAVGVRPTCRAHQGAWPEWRKQRWLVLCLLCVCSWSVLSFLVCISRPSYRA